MASNPNHFLINPRDRDARRATFEVVYSEHADVCGDLDYRLSSLTLCNDPIDPAFLHVFRDDGRTSESMGLSGVPYNPLTARAEGAQGMGWSGGIDVTQPGLNPGPAAEPLVATQEHDVNSTVGPQSRDETPQKTLTCEWKDCNQKRPFRREAALMRHIKTIHVRPHDYGCPVEGCSRVFNRKDNLKVHLEKRH